MLASWRASSPTTPQILHGSQIDRYQSKTLPGAIQGRLPPAVYTRNFVIMYELAPAPEAFDYFVTRYVVIAGTKPAN